MSRRGQGHNDYPTQTAGEEVVGPAAVALRHHITSGAPPRDDGSISRWYPGLPAHLAAPGSASLKVTAYQCPLANLQGRRLTSVGCILTCLLLPRTTGCLTLISPITGARLPCSKPLSGCSLHSHLQGSLPTMQ